MGKDALPQPPNWRLGALFAAYFGLAGLLAPYMPLYFQARCLDAFQMVAGAPSPRVIGPNWGYRRPCTRRTPILAALSLR
jgi:hypothetical protein